MFSVWPLADGRRDSGHIEATSVMARTVGLWTYGSMPKPGSTDSRSGYSAETETGPKVIL